MSGYVTCIGVCFGCKRTFCFNPHKVPSVVVDGTREPVCRDCVQIANPRRIANGLPPIEILPDAYEALPESAL